jgi:hypothetical protein
MSDEYEKRQTALRQINQYWGDKYPEIVRRLLIHRNKGWTKPQMLAAISFLGVEGYPAHALFDHIEDRRRD